MSTVVPPTVERSVVKSIYDATLKNIEQFKVQCPGLVKATIACPFLPNPDTSGNALKRRDVKGPRIVIFVHPNLPLSYRSSVRWCQVDIICMTPPDDDPDFDLAVYLYYSARKVFDNYEMDFPADVGELQGFLFTSSEAGFQETGGYAVSFSVNVRVGVKQHGEQT